MPKRERGDNAGGDADIAARHRTKAFHSSTAVESKRNYGCSPAQFGRDRADPIGLEAATNNPARLNKAHGLAGLVHALGHLEK